MVAALRTAAASLVRARAPLTLARAAPVARAAAVAPRFTPVRFYAASAGLSKSDIESRIVDVLKTFEKVDPSKVCTSLSFLRCCSLAAHVPATRFSLRPSRQACASGLPPSQAA
jgi:hypothetical protein